ncbi:MAG: putative Ig domain-containing protein [Pirellulales bacterium]
MAWSFFGNGSRAGQNNTQQPQGRKRKGKGGRRPLFEELEARHVLATFTVTNLTDAAVAPAGSLRDAINQANAAPGADIIQFQSGLTGTLSLAAGAGDLDITESLTINGPGMTNLTIDATAATSRIFNITDEAGDVSIKGMALTKGAAGVGNDGGAIFSESLGLVTVADSTLTGNSAGDDGGAIYTAGNLSLINVTIGGVGAGLPNTAVGDGGAIYSAGNVTLSNSTITGNTAGGDGGGIYASGTVTLKNSTIGGTVAGAGNTANSSGGGIFGNTIDLTNSSASGNTATNTDGGGIYAKGNVTLLNSTVTGNTAGDDGGGIYGLLSVNITNSTIGGIAGSTANKAADDGGGIYATNVVLQNSTVAGNEAQDGLDGNGGGVLGVVSAMIKNSTIANNKAGNDGGGVFSANVTLQDATVASNIADSNTGGNGRGGGVFAGNKFTMQNSIAVGNTGQATNPELFIPAGNNSKVKSSLIANNTGLPAGAQFTVTGPAGALNGSGNLIGQPGGANAITVTDVFGAGGSTLADNGGPTPTIALATGSIVIDKGKNSLAVSSSYGDQRGLPNVRVFNNTVDMGAYEFQPPAPANAAPIVANSIPDQTALVDTPYVFTFAANTFTDANGDALTYTATLSGGGALPAWLTFNAAARTFIGVPSATDVGTITVRVTASDGNGGVVSDDFDLTVATNPPPTVTNPLPDRTATVGVNFNFTFAANTFTDPNGEPLTYTATQASGAALPAWLSFNQGTRTFTGTPAAGDAGTLHVRVTAADPHGNTVFDDYDIVVSTSELPFNENFESTPDSRIVVQSGIFATSTTNPVNGTASYQATRPQNGDKPVATVNFGLPTTPANVSNVNVNVSLNGGNGHSLWSNAVIVFDYVSPTNYKFAGVFEIIDKLIIGQVVNGKVQYLAQKSFPAAPNTTIPLSLNINRANQQVTLASGGTIFSYTYKTLGTGTIGLGTINANSRFDMLSIT